MRHIHAYYRSVYLTSSVGVTTLASPSWLCDDARMRTRVPAVVLPSELGEFTDEVRRVFAELGRTFGSESLAGECSPLVDVYETDQTVEIVADMPAVEQGALRIIVKGAGVLIAGEKAPRRGPH